MDRPWAWVARKSGSKSSPQTSGRIEPMVIATPSSTNCVTSCCPNRGIQGPAMERLIHYACSQEPRLTNEEGRALLSSEGGNLEGDAKPRYQKALELVRRERKADLLMRLAEMNAWETAGRGDPEAYRQVEALMNRASNGARHQPASASAHAVLPNRASFHEGQGRRGRQGRIQDGVLVTALRLHRDARSPEERGIDKVLSTYPKAQERFELLRRQPGFTRRRPERRLRPSSKSSTYGGSTSSRVLVRMRATFPLRASTRSTR